MPNHPLAPVYIISSDDPFLKKERSDALVRQARATLNDPVLMVFTQQDFGTSGKANLSMLENELLDPGLFGGDRIIKIYLGELKSIANQVLTLLGSRTRPGVVCIVETARITKKLADAKALDYSAASAKDKDKATTEKALEGVVKTFSADTAPYINGYAATEVSPSGEQTITNDITVTYTYAISNTTWYINHLDNVNSFSSSVNIAGRGWVISDTNAAYDALIGKPINTAAFFTNKTSQNVAVTKISSKGAESGELIATVTATIPSATKQLATITFPEVTLADGEYLSLFSQDDANINFYYASGSVTDANGIADNGFMSRTPKVYGSGTAYTEFAGCLGFSFGYTTTE